MTTRPNIRQIKDAQYTFDSVAAMVAATFLKVGDRVQTLGYSTAGDGGGNNYEIVAAATGTDDGGSYIDLATHQAKGLFVSGEVSVKQFGVVGSGISDDTDALITCFELGGYIYVPEGDYLIENAGPDSGGVYVDLTRNTYVTCHPNARFFTDAASGVDNDLIRFSCPDAGVPDDGITFSWNGGIIDTRNQKNSTSMPFTANYPPDNLGTTGTADGLSVIGEYNDGTHKQGVENCVISGVRFIATDSKWESAGGDSSLNLGTGSAEVRGCFFKGARDLGIYYSSDSGTDGLGTHFKCIGNTFEDCMFGVSAKRGTDLVSIVGNTFRGCVQGIAAEAIVNRRGLSWSIANNVLDGYVFGIDVSSIDGVSIVGNVLINAGILLENGSAPTANFEAPEAIHFRGAGAGVISDNVITGKIAEYSAKTATGVTFSAIDIGGGSDNTNYCLVTKNIIKDVDEPFDIATNLSNQIYDNILINTDDDKYAIGDPLNIIRKGAELTIASGVVTALNSYHTLDTEADASSDDLDTINGGVDGMRLLMRPQSSTRTVVLKDGTGNLALAGDFSLTQLHDCIELVYDDGAGFWFEVSRSDNGA
jgi:hypothetical protein